MAFIGVRAEALLEPYWDARPSDLVKAEILTDWMAALQGYSPDEIRNACRAYLQGHDCRIKPKPGDIRRIIDTDRAARMAKLPKPRPVAAPATQTADERRKAAESIMAGFRRKTAEGEN
jgi:hypothetical protein